MADNTRLNEATTVGDLIATEDIGGVKHELVIVEYSDDAGGAIKVSPLHPLPTSEVAPTTILNNKVIVTTAGTRVVIASSTPCKSVTVKALIGNTGLIYVGNSSVSSANGFELSAGDSCSMDISNLNTVNIDSAVNGEGVSYIGNF